MCYVPNTQITTNFGIKEIKNINYSDLILTKEGYKPINAIIEKNINEKIYSISSQLSLSPLKITEEHPILVKKCSSKTKISLLNIKK